MKVESLKMANTLYDEMIEAKGHHTMVALALKEPPETMSMHLSIQNGNRAFQLTFRGTDSAWDCADLRKMLSVLSDITMYKAEASREKFEAFRPE